MPDSVGFPGLTAVALAKVKVPEPLASMVTETVAFGEAGGVGMANSGFRPAGAPVPLAPMAAQEPGAAVEPG